MEDSTSHILMILGLLVFDVVLFYLIWGKIKSWTTSNKRWLTLGYWLISLWVIACFWFLDWVFLNIASYTIRRAIIGSMAFVNIFKLLLAIYLIMDRLVVRIYPLFNRILKNPSPTQPVENAVSTMSRKKFLHRAAVMAATLPIAAKSFSIINRAYDYQVRRRRIALPNLPSGFHGMTIGQISDIHTGSFDNDIAVRGGVDLLMQEKADVIFFTGDLVNQESKEAKDYIHIFDKVKAPLGVYSVLGNHDYGDYRAWSSPKAKQQNLEDMKRAHRELGWDLLLNENRLLKTGQDQLAVLGVENWGIKRFSKYGEIHKTYQGSEDAPVKLLLSHDPSHWEAQVHDYPDIDVTFSGHTHGFQFGVEFGNFSWSPAQYLYKQWAGLYQKGPQYLYVNRGYGFIGMPGRIGINPEISIFELVKAESEQGR